MGCTTGIESPRKSSLEGFILAVHPTGMSYSYSNSHNWLGGKTIEEFYTNEMHGVWAISVKYIQCRHLICALNAWAPGA